MYDLLCIHDTKHILELQAVESYEETCKLRVSKNQKTICFDESVHFGDHIAICNLHIL